MNSAGKEKKPFIERAATHVLESRERWKDWVLRPEDYPPGPRGAMAVKDAIKAFMSADFAATYYPRLVEEYGKVILVPGPLHQFVVYIADAELHRQITMEPDDFPRADLQGLFEPIAGTIIAGEGKEQKRRRQLINPYLHKSVLPKYFPVVQEEAGKFFDRLDKNLTNDGVAIGPELVGLFSDISARLLANGAKLPDGLGLKIVNLISFFQQNPIGAKYRQTKAYVFEEVSKLLKQSETEDLGILSVYQQEVADGRMRHEEAIAEVTGFFNASVETTSNLLGWLMYFLAKDPARYQKFREEALKVFNGRTEIPTEEVEQLVYGLSCVDEAARLRPAVWRQLRRVGKEDQVIEHQGKKFKLPYTAQVFDLAQAIQTDPEIWGEDANEFNPEKHLDPKFLSTLPKGAYAPWAQGIHLCPGMPFSKYESVMILAHLALRYPTITFTENQKPVFGPILGFPHGAVMSIRS